MASQSAKIRNRSSELEDFSLEHSSMEGLSAESWLRLELQAAFGRLMHAVGHELMNQQNGVQVNAQLISALAVLPEPNRESALLETGAPAEEGAPAGEIGAASRRLLAESRRTVAMFNRMRGVGSALFNEGTGDTQFRVQQAVPELFGYLSGKRSHALVLCCPSELELGAQGLIALLSFLQGLSASAIGEIRVQLQTDGARIHWECETPNSAQAFVESFVEPEVVGGYAGAMFAWLRAEGHSGTLSAEGARCLLAIEQGGGSYRGD